MEKVFRPGLCHVHSKRYADSESLAIPSRDEEKIIFFLSNKKNKGLKSGSFVYLAYNA